MSVGTSVQSPTYSLSVQGGIISDEVRVQLQPWPDYVFEAGYVLQPLSEVEKYVQAHKHLPGVMTAQEVATNGLDLGQAQKAQMEKIEELYLHLIAMEKTARGAGSRKRRPENQSEKLILFQTLKLPDMKKHSFFFLFLAITALPLFGQNGRSLFNYVESPNLSPHQQHFLQVIARNPVNTAYRFVTVNAELFCQRRTADPESGRTRHGRAQ